MTTNPITGNPQVTQADSERLNSTGGNGSQAAARLAADDATCPARPESGPILFFDGVCGLCNRFVDFTISRDRRQRIRFAALQGETARERLPHSDVESLASVVWLDGEGAHRYSAAVVRALRQLSLGWRIVAGLIWAIPRPIRDFFYRQIASNRYRLFGKKETCRMPSPEERERFLP